MKIKANKFRDCVVCNDQKLVLRRDLTGKILNFAFGRKHGPHFKPAG